MCVSTGSRNPKKLDHHHLELTIVRFCGLSSLFFFFAGKFLLNSLSFKVKFEYFQSLGSFYFASII